MPSASFPCHFHKDRGPSPPPSPVARPPHPCTDAPASLSATLYVLAILTERPATFRVERLSARLFAWGQCGTNHPLPRRWTQSVTEPILVVLGLLDFGATCPSGATPGDNRCLSGPSNPVAFPWGLLKTWPAGRGAWPALAPAPALCRSHIRPSELVCEHEQLGTGAKPSLFLPTGQRKGASGAALQNVKWRRLWGQDGAALLHWWNLPSQRSLKPGCYAEVP